MSGLAALAVKEAAVASGLGTTFLPGIAPSAVDGFAVGTLLSGLCYLLVMAPRRRARRRSRTARKAIQKDATQTPSSHDVSGYATAPAYAAVGVMTDPFAESAEVVVPYPVAEVSVELPEVRNGGSSGHRLADTEAGHRPEVRRGAGRHAAPPSGVSSRMAGKRAAR
jgi:hypothetical protein